MIEKAEEITLKDIILKVGEYIKEVFSYWKWIAIVGIIFGVVKARKAYNTPVFYNEKLTFMMDENQSDPTLGLDFIGNFLGQSQDNNLIKILRLFESKKIIHNTLFDTISIEGKNDFLINHFLDLYKVESLVNRYKTLSIFNKPWIEEVLEDTNFRFTDGNVDEFTPKENLYLSLVFDRISGNEDENIKPLLTSELQEESGIMTLRMGSRYEEITLGVLQNIYKELSRFFIEKSTEKQAKTYRIMKTKKDSVLTKLKEKEFALADFKDRNRNLVTVKGSLQMMRLQRDVNILNVMYSEVVKQLEITDFALKNKTPVVQVIDLPRRPIRGNRPSVISALIIGGLFGGVMVGFLVTLKKLWNDIME